MPPGGSRPLRSGGQNQKLPISGQGGYITPAAWGVPTTSERGAESEVAHKWAKWLHKPCRLGGPHRKQKAYTARAIVGKNATNGAYSRRSAASAVLGAYSHRSAASAFILVWVSAHASLGLGTTCCFNCHMGSRPSSYLKSACTGAQQSGGQNQKWPTSGQCGYLTPAVSGIPTAAERGDKIRSGPQVGNVATSPLPQWGSPPLQSGG